MSKTIRKAAAFGAAACIMFTAAAESTGALAQVPAVIEMQAEPAELPAMPDAETELKFVSEPVVQEVTEEQKAAEEAAKAAAESAAKAKSANAASLRELVHKVDAPGNLTEQMRCLASAVYFEARGEPLAGQLAVAKVIMNRAESGQFPSSYCSVVKQRSQFSFVKGGRIPAPRTGTAAWQRAKAIAHIAHHDLWDSEAQDSLYFHANYVRPSWARKKTARAQIKTHIFYR